MYPHSKTYWVHFCITVCLEMLNLMTESCKTPTWLSQKVDKPWKHIDQELKPGLELIFYYLLLSLLLIYLLSFKYNWCKPKKNSPEAVIEGLCLWLKDDLNDTKWLQLINHTFGLFLRRVILLLPFFEVQPCQAARTPNTLRQPLASCISPSTDRFEYANPFTAGTREHRAVKKQLCLQTK